MQLPELLCPAGSLEKLKISVLYGANAVYLGGQNFGLRQRSENFTTEELIEGVKFAHDRNVLVFVVLNSFLHDQDLLALPKFLEILEKIKVDAVIVSDLGVIETVKKHSSIPIHLSTQASSLNSFSAKFYKKMGVSRIVLGREITISEAKKIKEEAGVEVELFVHGSMCMSYSGNCVISNFTQGRDSNRGGCAHSCRFEYSFDNLEQEKLNAYFMSSKDLNGLRVLEEFIKAGIDSIKIEGRNKSHHYAGTVAKVYSEALSFYKQNGHFLSDKMYYWESELKKLSHRDYTTASLIDKASDDSIYNSRENDENEWTVVGVVLKVFEQQFVVIDVKSAFKPGDTLEFMPFVGDVFEFQIPFIQSMSGEVVLKTKPGTLVKLPFISNVQKWNLVRKKETLA